FRLRPRVRRQGGRRLNGASPRCRSGSTASRNASRAGPGSPDAYPRSRRSDALQLIGLVFARQRVDQFVEVALEDFREAIKRQVDAVIGDAALRIVVRADALAAIAGADLQL